MHPITGQAGVTLGSRGASAGPGISKGTGAGSTDSIPEAFNDQQILTAGCFGTLHLPIRYLR